MVRRKQTTPRKKKVRWLDLIQAEASRPCASYSPPHINEAGIIKFINKEAAKQRRAQVNRMTGAAYSPFLHVCQKETTPPRQSSSTHAKEEIRPTKNLPDPDGTGAGLSQHCSASVFSSQIIDLQFLSGTCPSQQTESGPVAIKGPRTLKRASFSSS